MRHCTKGNKVILNNIGLIFQEICLMNYIPYQSLFSVCYIWDYEDIIQTFCSPVNVLFSVLACNSSRSGGIGICSIERHIHQYFSHFDHRLNLNDALDFDHHHCY